MMAPKEIRVSPVLNQGIKSTRGFGLQKKSQAILQDIQNEENIAKIEIIELILLKRRVIREMITNERKGSNGTR